MGYVAAVLLATLDLLLTLVTGVRKHKNLGPILVLNNFLGWTFLG